MLFCVTLNGMDDLEILMQLGLALSIGLLFGLKHGWHGRSQSEGTRSAGIRTFALIRLFGGMSGWLASMTSPLFLAAALIGMGALSVVSYRAQVKTDRDIGLTTEVALLLVFALGAASVLGGMVPAAAVAVVAAFFAVVEGAVAQIGNADRST